MIFLFSIFCLLKFATPSELLVETAPEVILKGAGRCHGKHFSCGKAIRNADVGKTMLVESPKFPEKVTCGVNCVIKIQTEPENKIVIRWKGFLIDGCHEGNKMRITDGDMSKSFCGDKLPNTFVSKNNVIEIAFSVVDMGRADRGVYYKFTYEAAKPGQIARGVRKPTRRPKQPTTRQAVQKQQQHQQQQQQHQQQQPQQPQKSNQKPQKSTQWSTQEQKRKNVRKPNDIVAHNYNIRYQNNRDYEHSFGQSYQNSQLELLEEIEELDELEKIEESVNSAKPYIFMASAIVLILVSVALILKTIFCKSNSLHEDIKHFT